MDGYTGTVTGIFIDIDVGNRHQYRYKYARVAKCPTATEVKFGK